MEIGTSHWATVVHVMANGPGWIDPRYWRDMGGSPFARYAELAERDYLRRMQIARGLAVDTVREYVEMLPLLPHVQREAIAVGAENSWELMHLVPPKLVQDTAAWARRQQHKGS